MKAYRCVFCERIYEGYGNNPLPLKKGECCDSCNATIVIPERIKRMKESRRW